MEVTNVFTINIKITFAQSHVSLSTTYFNFYDVNYVKSLLRNNIDMKDLRKLM